MELWIGLGLRRFSDERVNRMREGQRDELADVVTIQMDLLQGNGMVRQKRKGKEVGVNKETQWDSLFSYIRAAFLFGRFFACSSS